MNLNELERKYGRYAIPNLSKWILVTYVIGYILYYAAPNALYLLLLDPYKIMHGQVWRLISWVLMPPGSFDFFTLINLYFFFSIGRTMEQMWGDFRYNVYIFSGILFSIIGAFLIYAIGALTGTMGAGTSGLEAFSLGLSTWFSTYYINISVLLAFAMSIPDAQVLFWFIIPLKFKWLAYIEGFFILRSFVMCGSAVGRVAIVASLFNFVVFYLSSRNFKRITPKEIHRKQVYRTQMNQSSTVTRHKCAICGRTELDDPSLTFRFCSKCDGNYEYCQDHLFTHEHIKMK